MVYLIFEKTPESPVSCKAPIVHVARYSCAAIPHQNPRLTLLRSGMVILKTESTMMNRQHDLPPGMHVSLTILKQECLSHLACLIGKCYVLGWGAGETAEILFDDTSMGAGTRGNL